MDKAHILGLEFIIMSYEITQVSIALFAIFLSVSTWYLTGDVLPAYVGSVIAALILISYFYYFKLNLSKLSVNVNPEETTFEKKSKKK